MLSEDTQARSKKQETRSKKQEATEENIAASR
jgi:hypothetical protein